MLNIEKYKDDILNTEQADIICCVTELLCIGECFEDCKECKKECYEKTLEAKENELKLKMHKNRVLYENKIKKIQQIIERL